ncbi:MAG: YibE/F family protein [Tissierellia bacterium]|nr:YibE/F family protein [Tissierellia bacterium]
MKSKENIIVLIFLLAIIILIFIPTGFQRPIYYNSENCKARVLEVNNSNIYEVGHFRQGEQLLKVEILSGSKKGEVTSAVNLLSGKLEEDTLATKGSIMMLLIEKDDYGNIVHANTVDYYRLDYSIVLVLIFALALVAFSGYTGVKTLISFIFTILVLLKVLVPMMLKGFSPLATSIVIGFFITLATVLLISGLNERSYSAILATAISGLFTLFISVVFTRVMKIDGTVLPWAESLIYAGFEDLNLTGIFQSAVYLSCLGAVIDLAVDISTALWEIVENHPEVKRVNLIKSGMEIGRTVVGSQVTTLLLAYSGSYLSIIMVYMAQATPVLNILTTKTISSEILNTFVGALALVLVAPITALISSYRFKKIEE